MKEQKHSAPSNRQRLTAALIRGFKPRDKDYYVRDAEVPRLQLKVTPAGNKSFIVRYRNQDRRERKIKIGDFPDLNVTVARRLASDMLLQVGLGEDPAARKRRRKDGVTFREFSQRFLENYADVHLRTSTVRNYRQILNSVLVPRFGAMKLHSIVREDVEAMQREKRQVPYQANRSVRLLRKIFNYAIENAVLKDGHNPTQNVRLFKESARERLLNKEEQSRIGIALEQLRRDRPENTPSYDAIIFLFLTGCRKGEALGLRWEDIDFDRQHLRFHKTKTVPRVQQMSKRLTEFLQSIDSQRYSPYVFPGRNSDYSLTDIKKSWTRTLQVAGLKGVRLHDIRHTVLSDIAAKTDIQTASLVAGHRSLQSTMRYVHGHAEATKSALQLVAEERSALLTPPKQC